MFRIEADPDRYDCFNDLLRELESGQVSHSDKILSALLTEMDGMGGKIQEEFSSGRCSGSGSAWIGNFLPPDS